MPEGGRRVSGRSDKERVFLAGDWVFGQGEGVDLHAVYGRFVAAVAVAAHGEIAAGDID